MVLHKRTDLYTRCTSRFGARLGAAYAVNSVIASSLLICSCKIIIGSEGRSVLLIWLSHALVLIGSLFLTEELIDTTGHPGAVGTAVGRSVACHSKSKRSDDQKKVRVRRLMHKLRLHFPRINKKLQLAFSLPETTANLMLQMFYWRLFLKNLLCNQIGSLVSLTKGN